MFRAIRIALGFLALMVSAPVTRAQEPVDLLLVLAADVSRSVDHAKFQLQREGYAAAISDKRVLDAITAGRHRRIGVIFIEWSGSNAQQVSAQAKLSACSVSSWARMASGSTGCAIIHGGWEVSCMSDVREASVGHEFSGE